MTLKGNRKLSNLEERADRRIDGKLPCVSPDWIGSVIEAGIFDEILKVTIGTSAPALPQMRGAQVSGQMGPTT